MNTINNNKKNDIAGDLLNENNYFNLLKLFSRIKKEKNLTIKRPQIFINNGLYQLSKLYKFSRIRNEKFTFKPDVQYVLTGIAALCKLTLSRLEETWLEELPEIYSIFEMESIITKQLPSPPGFLTNKYLIEDVMIYLMQNVLDKDFINKLLIVVNPLKDNVSAIATLFLYNISQMGSKQSILAIESIKRVKDAMIAISKKSNRTIQENMILFESMLFCNLKSFFDISNEVVNGKNIAFEYKNSSETPSILQLFTNELITPKEMLLEKMHLVKLSFYCAMREIEREKKINDSKLIASNILNLILSVIEQKGLKKYWILNFYSFLLLNFFRFKKLNGLIDVNTEFEEKLFDNFFTLIENIININKTTLNGIDQESFRKIQNILREIYEIGLSGIDNRNNKQKKIDISNIMSIVTKKPSYPTIKIVSDIIKTSIDYEMTIVDLKDHIKNLMVASEKFDCVIKDVNSAYLFYYMKSDIKNIEETVINFIIKLCQINPTHFYDISLFVLIVGVTKKMMFFLRDEKLFITVEDGKKKFIASLTKLVLGFLNVKVNDPNVIALQNKRKKEFLSLLLSLVGWNFFIMLFKEITKLNEIDLIKIWTIDVEISNVQKNIIFRRSIEVMKNAIPDEKLKKQLEILQKIENTRQFVKSEELDIGLETYYLRVIDLLLNNPYFQGRD